MKRLLLISAFLAMLSASPGLSQVSPQVAFPGLPFWNRPIGLIDPYDGTDRLFLMEHRGVIHVFENDPSVTTTRVFLDIEYKVNRIGESGLLGLAFHPDYENNGRVYVFYSTAVDSLRSVLSCFTVSSDPDSLDESTELVLLNIPRTNTYHVGGRLTFGPDGYLWLFVGDDGVPSNGQDRTTLPGAMLRLDVDNPSGGLNYGIPPTNPFVGNMDGYREEIYAWGMRNTWGYSYDATTDRWWGGDVGLDTYEEVNILENGKNYGWPVLEGPACYIPNPCDTTGLNFTNPIHYYDHSVGSAIIGGWVYRGSRIPSLYGYYVFADYVAGKFWAMDYDGVNPPTVYSLYENGSFGPMFTFAVDKDNQLFFTNGNGRIYWFTGEFVPVGIGTPTDNPRVARLEQNYPNPFNPQTMIAYSVDRAAHIQIDIYNVEGRLVRDLVNRNVAPGSYHAEWDGKDDAGRLRASGVYFYRLTVDGAMAQTRRMVLLK